MIRKAILLTLLLLAPTFVFGAAPARDILLTPNGTLYTVESVDPDVIDVESSSVRVLQLTMRNGAETSKQVIPATLVGASQHTKPALAYDAYSDTLFVFWQKARNAMSSELLFCSFSKGTWSEATSIDQSSYNVRFGLKIAATPYVTSQINGETERRKMLTIHAVWWEQTGYGEEARYAMLSLHDGKVIQSDLRRLSDFASGRRTEIPAEVAEDFDRSIFRAPSIVTNASNDSVEVVFADWDRNRFQRVTIRPILAQGVIRVPDGIWRGEVGAPGGRIATATNFEVIAGAGDTIALYGEDAEEVRYLLYKDGVWSPSRSLQLSNDLTNEAAIGAIRRLAASQ